MPLLSLSADSCRFSVGATLIVLLMLCPTQGQAAIQLPGGFIDEAVITGLPGELIAFEQSADGVYYLAEKSGIVRVWDAGALQSEPFLDISAQVNDRVDRGLLGLALHPQFPAVPYIYLGFTYDPPALASLVQDDPGRFDGNGNRVARVVRYTADAARNYKQAVAGSEQIILGKNSTYENIGDPEGLENTLTPSCGPPGAPINDCMPVDEVTHTIGSLRFMPDGSLLVTHGDGATYRNPSEVAFMVQDLNSLRGKILRVDPETGHGLSDNPFYNGTPDSNRARVLSYGLRNPYSLALHPDTAEPYVGDVGWNLWEDIHGGSGKNFGWPCYEGNDTGNLQRIGFSEQAYCIEFYAGNPAISPPIDSWLRGQTGAAMVGDFYNGQVFPELWQGKLFYYDFLQGWMKAIDVDGSEPNQSFAFATQIPPITQMTSADDGAFYYASVSTGELRRIRYTRAPTAQTHPESFGRTNATGAVVVGTGAAGLWFGWLLGLAGMLRVLAYLQHPRPPYNPLMS